MKKQIMSKLAVALFIASLVMVGSVSKVNAETSVDDQISLLQSQINDLTAQLKTLQGGAILGTSSKWCYNFNFNFGIGSSGDEVIALGRALNYSGTQLYDESWASLVSGFQQKYSNDILTPSGLQYPTGFVGNFTRAKLNALYGCATAISPAPAAAPYPSPAPTSTPIRKPVPTETILAKFNYDNGSFVRYQSSASTAIMWREVLKNPSGLTFNFKEYSQDKLSYYLIDSSRNVRISIPRSGGMSQISTNSGITWWNLYYLTLEGAAPPQITNLSVSADNVTAPATTIIAGAPRALLGAYSVNVSGNPVMVNKQVFRLIGDSMSYSSLNNFVIKDSQGIVLAGPVNMSADGTLTFVDSIKYPVGTSYYRIYGDVATNIVSGSVFHLRTTPSIDWTGDSASYSSTQVDMSNITAVSSGVLGVTKSSLNPQSSVATLGTKEVTALVLDLGSKYETAQLKSITLGFNGNNINDIGRVTIWDGSIQIAEAIVPPNKTAVFYLASPLYITKDSKRTITAKIDISQYAIVGDVISLGFSGLATATGLDSGSTMPVSSANIVGSSITIVSGTTKTPAGPTNVDLTEYLPGTSLVQSWFDSANPALPNKGVRWANRANYTSAGDQWFRWQFSGYPSEGTYDVMYWSTYDKNLHYSSTNLGCDTSGNNCTDVTTFAQSITFAPRYFNTGTTVTGSGTSDITRTFVGGVCKGKVNYDWKAEPYAGELASNSKVDVSQPITHFSVHEVFYNMTGPAGQCGNFEYVEHWYLGTACVAGVCNKAILSTWGGNLPYANDASHWNLNFSGFSN